jgi:hypothetical protein
VQHRAQQGVNLSGAALMTLWAEEWQMGAEQASAATIEEASQILAYDTSPAPRDVCHCKCCCSGTVRCIGVRSATVR